MAWAMVVAAVTVAALLTTPIRAERDHVAPEYGAQDADARSEASFALSAPQRLPAPSDPQALKLIVDRDGPVVVTGAHLAAAGWDLTDIAVGGLTLASDGMQVPLHIDGGSDGELGPADRLVFHGRAMAGLYTRENVYWLQTGGTALEMTRRAAPYDRSVPLAHWYRETVHEERDATYFGSMHTDFPEDRWLWGEALHAPASRDYPVKLGNLSPAAEDALLSVRLYGYTDDPAVEPDHHVTLRWNGEVVHSEPFDGIGMHVSDAVVPARLLRAGDNTLSVQNSGRTGAIVDAVALDWIELAHDAGYTSDGERLEFGAPEPGRQSFTVGGFESPANWVLDITDPARPDLLTDTRVEPDGTSGYRVRFTDTSVEGARYVAFILDRSPGPSRIEPNSASWLRSPDNGADYIVVTHRDFAGALAPLLEHREAQGLRVALVDIEDIYDEFAHGVFDPRAIRSFLQHAHGSWQPPAPSYVLLVGEANLDYRGAYGVGSDNFVPSIQVGVTMSGELGAVTSDLWFANLDPDERDVVPEVMLGRFPVSTAAQAATIVSKTLAYESIEPGVGWQRGAVMVVDDDGGGTFEPFSEALIAHMPNEDGVRRFYARTYPRDRDISADISSAVTDGALVLNYVGHGNVELWGPWPGGGRIYENGDISRLANGSRLPLFTSATCMNGWIDHPLKPTAMAELWLTQPGGGGVAAWSPSGFTATARESVLFGSLFEGLYDGRGLSIGALTAEALATAAEESPESADTIRQFVLLGDPALVVSGVEVQPAASPTPTRAASPSPTPTATSTAKALLLPWLSKPLLEQ